MMSESTRRRFLVQAGALPLAAAIPLRAQDSGGLPSRAWNARWISAPGSHPTEYGVYHFRRALDLPSKPDRFLVHVSADNRYQLFVNGQRAAWGPARGDLFHWRYETIDMAPYLQAGRNVLAALVWNFDDLAPEAQITLETGFLLQGDTDAERAADTGPAWKVLRNDAYSPIVFTSGQMHGYFVTGPGDRVSAAAHPWGWETREFDDSNWPGAVAVGPAAGREARDAHSRWMLVPRTIPAMEENAGTASTGAPRRGNSAAPDVSSPARAAAHPRSHACRSAARPDLPDHCLSRTDRQRRQRCRRQDALCRNPVRTAQARQPRLDKGNRNEIEGKQFIGNHDEFVADGGARRTFRPLWWRTYRYLELDVETKDQPLTVDDLTATYVGYPFERRAAFDAGSPEVARILEVGWRTARLCAHETYMDCPYYEQLQYVGDTRVQCLVSLFNSGDARLMRNAIDLINDSRHSDGCTMSRYPDPPASSTFPASLFGGSAWCTTTGGMSTIRPLCAGCSPACAPS